MDWGDGTGDQCSPGGGGDDDGQQSFSHAYAHGDTDYVASVAVETEDGVFVATRRIHVNPGPASPDWVDPFLWVAQQSSAVEGSPFQFAIHCAPDDGSGSSYQIDWGDGSSDTAGRVDGENLVGSHTYEEEGRYLVHVTGGQYPGWAYVDVADPAATIDSVPDQTIDSGDEADVSATFSDPGGDGDHRAFIDWGDGRGWQSAEVEENGDGSGTITASVDDLKPGTYACQLELVEADGAPLETVSFTQTVNAPTGQVDSLTVADQAQAGNSITMTDAQIKRIYVAVDSNGAAKLTATTTQSGSGKRVYHVFGPEGGTWSGTTLTLRPPNGHGVYNLSAGIDKNGNGQLDANEIDRTASISVIRVRLVDANGHPLDLPVTSLVGRKVTLGYRVDGDAGLPAPTASWSSLPGAAVANYQPTSASAHPTFLTANQMAQNTITFYFTAPTTEREPITCNVTIAGRATFPATQDFTVESPSGSFVATTTPTGISWIPSLTGPSRVGFGLQIPADVGIAATANVFVPDTADSGEIAFVQLVKGSYEYYLPFGNAEIKHYKIYSQWVLDGGSVQYPNSTQAVIRGKTGESKFEDSPSTFAGDKSSRADNFSLYLMYRPAGGIWVTLAKSSWWWYYAGVNQIDGFHFTTKDYSKGTQVQPSTVNDLPEWDNYIKNIQEQEMLAPPGWRET